MQHKVGRPDCKLVITKLLQKRMLETETRAAGMITSVLNAFQHGVEVDMSMVAEYIQTGRPYDSSHTFPKLFMQSYVASFLNLKQDRRSLNKRKDPETKETVFTPAPEAKLNYTLRGEELEHLCLYEFAHFEKRVLKKTQGEDEDEDETQDDDHGVEKGKRVYKFLPTHPEYDTNGMARMQGKRPEIVALYGLTLPSYDRLVGEDPYFFLLLFYILSWEDLLSLYSPP
jgi:hypothetical protein